MAQSRNPIAVAATDAASLVAPEVRVFDSDECWRLLEAHALGRLAVRAGDGVDIFPINYLVHNRGIYFRTGPGAKIIDLTRHSNVAFEIDGQLAHHLWSVVVTGDANRLASDAEIEESGIQLLAAWHPGEKFNYVRVRPQNVTGRSFSKP
jgi:nitroimidazol reductase NimA-like FMN-containing flavoprotein (pyridoxamine 5'-phosphate oxidase superfamily)